MSKALVLLALVSSASAVYAQSPMPPTTPDGPYEVVEVQPELIGGLAALQERVVYPSEARAEGVEGTVVVQFVVDERGAVTAPTVVRTPDPRLGAAALAAVEGATFTPGTMGGRAVPVRFALPVTFRLGRDEGGLVPQDVPASDVDSLTRQGVSKSWSDRSPGSVSWKTEWSDNVDRLVDRIASAQEGVWAQMMAGVAYQGVPFEGLAPGSATVRFVVSPEGRAGQIEVSGASSEVVERFARFQALAARFTPEAAGASGTLAVTVVRVDR